jgi:predicted nuclease of predicted toxin-antitoxin system
MPLSAGLARWLRNLGHDAVHAGDIGLARAANDQILDEARRQRRTILTADLDYPRLLAQARAAEPSVILFRDGEWSDDQVNQRMSDVLASMSEAEIEESIVVVERDRIRRRPLPLS